MHINQDFQPNQRTVEENNIIALIKNTTLKKNYDNISRTESYNLYFKRNPEIRWAFLAGMVSRNAGYCMTDLKGTWFQKMINNKMIKALFLTYEDANWLIFSDAFPQLMLYEISKKTGRPLFHLLDEFHVSPFMKKVWHDFWEEKNIEHLMTSLIINEQHLIQKPIIEKAVFKRKVFHTPMFFFQDLFHFSTVVFPTIEGRLFGFSVHDFKKLKSRIKLGRSLAWLLFHPDFFPYFMDFSERTTHTGSRFDYEKYLSGGRKRDTPYLRTSYPVISHQLDVKERNWFHGQPMKKWYSPLPRPKELEMTEWLINKQNQMHAFSLLNEYVINKGKRSKD
ncbi:DUF2515 domain-containing protein [Metabacillus idriensis]|uniref:DUF2515 domain-containing protein n=1 Tax=Metabacillus idriensis TaxID=324768 RepID=UPI003D2C87F3